MKTIIFLSLILTPITLHAATLFVATPQKVLENTIVRAKITLDTKGEAVNTISAAFIFNDTNVSFSGYDASSSPVQLWIKEPQIIGPGVVSFSGIVPGGATATYDPFSKNNRLPVVDLLFTTHTDVFDLEPQETLLLAHDGKGTPIEHSVVFEVLGTDSTKLEDIIKPSALNLTYVPSSLFSRTPSFVSFQAHDGESGIKYYEAKIGNHGWKKVENPLIIPKNILARKVTVRAYDYAGNFAETSIPLVRNTPLIVVLSSVTIFIFFIICRMIIRRRTNV